MSGIGARLREGREAAGLSVAQVAAKLRLSSAQVMALEAGRSAELPPAPYVRGYIRSYGQLLGLSGEELGRPMIPPPVMPAFPEEPVSVRTGKRSSLGAAVAVLAVVVIAFLTLWWRGGTHGSQGERQVSAAQTRDAHAGLPPRLQLLAVPGKTTGQLSRFPLREESGKGVAARAHKAPASGPVQVSAPPVGTTPRKMTATAPAARGAVPVHRGLVSLPPGPHATLRVSATTADCWLAVYDAHGQQLAYQLVHRGQAVQVAGTPPFRVSLGNPVGMRVTFDGHAVGLPGNAQPGQVVHLQVGSQPG